MFENPDRKLEYKSYWLRCWPAGDQKGGATKYWRYSLEDPVTGHKRGFTDLQTLVMFIEHELDCQDRGWIAKQDPGGL